MTAIRKVAVTGPESTGKSKLCRDLANHYKGLFVPEHARAYIDQLGRPYQQDDILAIAKGQLAIEQKIVDQAGKMSAKPIVFCDTELIVTKVWSIHKYDSCDFWILDQIESNHYDLFLLCDVDLPWEPDMQREHPELRSYFFDWYRLELENYNFPYHVVMGDGENRLNNAVRLIDSALQ